MTDLKCNHCNKQITTRRKPIHKKYFCNHSCRAAEQKIILNEKKCFQCNCLFIPKGRTQVNKFCSKNCRYEFQKTLTKEKCPSYGRVMTKEQKEKISVFFTGRQVGDKNPSWKGGVTSKNKLIRGSVQYKKWRNSVFERDCYTCQHCNAKSGKGKHVQLNADHIKPFALFPELRFELSNGRTLCVECHRKTNTWGGRISNY